MKLLFFSFTSLRRILGYLLLFGFGVLVGGTYVYYRGIGFEVEPETAIIALACYAAVLSAIVFLDKNHQLTIRN